MGGGTDAQPSAPRRSQMKRNAPICAPHLPLPGRYSPSWTSMPSRFRPCSRGTRYASACSQSLHCLSTSNPAVRFAVLHGICQLKKKYVRAIFRNAIRSTPSREAGGRVEGAWLAASCYTPGRYPLRGTSQGGIPHSSPPFMNYCPLTIFLPTTCLRFLLEFFSLRTF